MASICRLHSFAHVGSLHLKLSEDNYISTYNIHLSLRIHDLMLLRMHTDDQHKLYSTSYDGTIRCIDLTRGPITSSSSSSSSSAAFEQVYANDVEEDYFLTFSHIAPTTGTMLISDSGGQVTAIDLRAPVGDIAWRHELHPKKVLLQVNQSTLAYALVTQWCIKDTVSMLL
jgi:hypothetical protein